MGYMGYMEAILSLLFKLLELLFFAGMAGSAIVIMITTVEDLKILFHSDEPVVAPNPGID